VDAFIDSIHARDIAAPPPADEVQHTRKLRLFVPPITAQPFRQSFPWVDRWLLTALKVLISGRFAVRNLVLD
jgi:hypothetical protein